MTLSDLCREYLQKYPNKSKRALATLICNNHPDISKNIEAVRTTIRYLTGASGDKARKEVKFFEKNEYGKWVQAYLNQDQRPWDDPFVIPNSIKQLNIIADIHSIHLDAKVLDQFMRQTKDKTALLINGDLLDSESLSRHMKLHNLVDYEHELDMCNKLLEGLKQEFNHVYFKAGNHDYWLERYLLNNAREIFRLRGIQVQELLQCAGLGVEYIHNLRYIKYGDLDIMHGHEFNTAYGNGKYPAGGYVDKWQTFTGRYEVKILASHCHRQDYVVSKRSKDGKYGYGWVTPAMCRKGASYNPYAGWDNGWAVAYNNDGIVSVQIVVV
jgi:hypothetical protein